MNKGLTPYRLTYTTDKQTIFTEILVTDAQGFSGIVNHAVLHLGDILEEGIDEVKAFSVVIETKDEEVKH